MRAMNQPGCQPCCVSQPGCLEDITTSPCDDDGGRGCLKCAPRYRCALVRFTPLEYSTLCPYTSRPKLFYSCLDTWVSQTDSAVSVTVQIYKQSNGYGCECVYRVTVAADGDSTVYEGVDQDDLNTLTYTHETDEGSYEVTLSSASVIANPLASKHCAPCICATCIPSALAIDVTATDLCGVIRRQCQTVGFDCGTDAYDTATIETAHGDVNVTVRLADDGTCSIIADIPAIGYATGDATLTIGLESGPESECSPVEVFRCLEVPSGDTDGFLVGSRGSGSCEGENKTPQIDASIDLLAEDGLTVIATVRIRDAACLECNVPSTERCPGTCASLGLFPTEGSMCAPPNLTATFIHDGCDDIDGQSFTMIPASEGDQPFNTVAPVTHDECSFVSNNGFTSLVDFSLACATNDPPATGKCGPAFYTVTALLVYLPLTCEGEAEEDLTRYRLHLEISATCTYYGPSPFYTYMILEPDETSSSCSPLVFDFTLPTWASLHDRTPCCDAAGDFKLRITI